MIPDHEALKLYLNGDIAFDPARRIGGGGFGDLFKGAHHSDGILALKRLRSGSDTGGKVS